MNSSYQGRETCRIVLGLNAALNIESSVDAATTLASAIEAEVVGLFVEEDAMLDLAGLPFARALSLGTAQPEQLNRELMMQAFARGAQICRRTLSVRAEQTHVKWSFSTERGELPSRIRAALTAGDFLALPGEGHGIGVHHLIDELRSMPKHVRGVVVAAQRQAAQAKGPVVAIDDGDAMGHETVSLAARIAGVMSAPLMLFAIAATDAEADQIVRRAKMLAGPIVSMVVQRFLPGAPRSIAAAFMHITPSFVVADLDGEPFGDDQTMLYLLRAAKAPVVLVRAEGIGSKAV